MVINPAKATAMFCTLNNRYADKNLPSTSFEGIAILLEETLKYMGVTFDGQLNFTSYINTMLARTTRGINALIVEARHRAKEGHILQLYQIFIHSILNYALVMINVSAIWLDKIEKTQNTCLSLVTGRYLHVSPITPHSFKAPKAFTIKFFPRALQCEGKDSGLPSSKQEDPVAEERITQILNEAQHAILNSNSKNKKSPLHNGNTGYCSQNGNTPRSEEEREGGGIEGGGGNDGSLNSNNDCRDQYQANNYRRSRKYDNDDIPKEMVSRIYQEELAKLMGQRVEEGFCLSQNQYERTQEEIRHALNIYHQELSCLSQVFPLGASDLSHFTPAPALTNETACTTFSHPNSIANTHPRQEMPIDATVQSQNKRNEQRSGCSSETDSTCHHGSAFSLVRPKTEAVSSLVKAASSHQHNSNLIPLPPTSIMSYAEMPNSDEDLSTSASPLQQMQSITNSLLSQSSLTSISNNPQKPTKAILPPITQQQFDQYNNLNTEEIVKNVKEHLSQYSISQRLFGENILGLSQGSVSDLLARPKPWHMLTQKGREPFIRMKIFLEDENAVHKLVASQYKLPPEKLMRIGGFGGSVNLPAFSKLPHHPIESVSSHHSMFDKNQSAVNLKFPRPMDLQISTPSTAESSPSISLAPSSPTSAVSPTQRRQMSSKKPHHSPISVTTLEPSVYEMAALTTDLDTQSITSKIKDTLLAHNIGQK
ncbi:homeobox protein cut-like, partial [Limulus polyphemus]|uniref:Homeobox protein cut-like n=1 Tax=Limulus polyphemus TaxID=6850 RepID=A0ABM1BKD8_LIMPO